MKISIFIPTYNSGEILRETLDSVLGQTYKDIEVLAVDDSSTDGITQQILHEYEAKDSRLKVFVKPNEGDVPHSWNFVFPYLKGEFTFYMSHDDLLEPEAIEKMVRVAESDQEIDCVLTKMVRFEENFFHPEDEYALENQRYQENSTRGLIDGKKAFEEALNYKLPGFSIWRTDLIRREGMPTDSYNSDDLMHRLWKLKCRKVGFSDAAFYYRQTPNSITKLYKPYNFHGLRVLGELSKMLDDIDFIDQRSKDENIYNFFKYIRTYSAYYSRNKSKYSKNDRQLIELYLKDVYRNVAPRVHTFPKGLRGLFVKLEAMNFRFFMLLSKIDKV